MQLARIRTAPGAPVRLVARAPDEGENLVVIDHLDPSRAADPVRVLAEHGLEGVSAAVQAGGTMLFVDDVVFEPPVATCTKICCLALNYAAHAEESRLEVPPDPVLFFKPPSALLGHRAAVRPPARTRHVEHEVELAVVVGRQVRDLAEEDWASAVAGYTVINDMTARDLQLANLSRNQPWDQAKGFDTFAPIGPYLVTPDEIADPHDLEMVLTVDGEVRQRANTSQMVFRIPRLLADLTDGMTLMPGDVIATGTVAGISPVRDGEEMHAHVDRVGNLVNAVTWPTTPQAPLTAR